jgi:hypothetical protein
LSCKARLTYFYKLPAGISRAATLPSRDREEAEKPILVGS